MRNDLLDCALLLQIFERSSGEGAVDLQSIDQDGHCDQSVGLNIFVEFVGGRLVEDDCVVGLVLDCTKYESAVVPGVFPVP